MSGNPQPCPCYSANPSSCTLNHSVMVETRPRFVPMMDGDAERIGAQLAQFNLEVDQTYATPPAQRETNPRSRQPTRRRSSPSDGPSAYGNNTRRARLEHRSPPPNAATYAQRGSQSSLPLQPDGRPLGDGRAGYNNYQYPAPSPSLPQQQPRSPATYRDYQYSDDYQRPPPPLSPSSEPVYPDNAYPTREQSTQQLPPNYSRQYYEVQLGNESWTRNGPRAQFSGFAGSSNSPASYTSTRPPSQQSSRPAASAPRQASGRSHRSSSSNGSANYSPPTRSRASGTRTKKNDPQNKDPANFN